MAGYKETVLYYSPQADAKVRKVKSVLIRLGIRIRNVSKEQVSVQVGKLAGIGLTDEETDTRECGEEGIGRREIPEEVLVLCNFSNARLDQLLRELRKANASVALKAILTETNVKWSFYELYDEIRKEHEEMTKKQFDRT